MIERIEINLLPAEYRIHHRRFEVSSTIIGILLIMGVLAFLLAGISFNLVNSNRILNNQIKAVQSSIEINRPIQQEINKLKEDQKIINEKIRGLELINVNREKWVRLMEEFSNRLPEYTWLVSVKEEVGEKSVIYIEGRTLSFPEVANFMSNLKECRYISDIELSQIEQTDPKERIFKFSLSLKVNDNAYLNNTNSSSS